MNGVPSILLAFAVGAPGALFALLALAWMLGADLRENLIARLTRITYTLVTLALLALDLTMQIRGVKSFHVRLGDWFAAGEYRFPLDLLADHLSLPLMTLAALLTGLVAAFSARYMHREHGYLYFFLLLQLFGFGSLLLFSAGSFDLIVAGWEFVGITSVLLIAFFHQRPEPVRSGLRVFAVYRITDIGLLMGVVVLHHAAGTASMSLFQGTWPAQTASLSGASAAAVAWLFLLAAAGKAAQFPFSGWLPRAMEGPTPSSAIFYGAISVHAGAYLLLRAQPLLAESAWVSAATIAIGLLSAVFGTLIGRACTDAKTSLAYASVTQLGIIFVEIGLGFSYLAVWHICGHAIVRTLQFLRAPSALHEFHQMHAAAGGHLKPVGVVHEALIPERVRAWMYRAALDRGHMDTILDRFLVNPVLWLSHALNPGAALAWPARKRTSASTRPLMGEADV
jgi:NAD(P)H-quinone oxidoreductase subunit 5